jgi:hypothetical protein
MSKKPKPSGGKRESQTRPGEPKREPFDDAAKAFYRRWFEGRDIAVETEREVFARGRAIDLVVCCTEADLARLQDTIFAHFRRLNDLELKGVHDPLTLPGLNLIIMRAWGLGALEAEKADEAGNGRRAVPLATEEQDSATRRAEREANWLPSQRTVTIVCVTRPDKILDDLREEWRFYPTDEPGIYFCDAQLPQWIIYPTELELVPRNYPLLPLAKGEKLAQFIEICLREGRIDYLQLTLDVGLTTDPEVIWRKILEVKQMRPVLTEEAWRAMEEFFRQTPEATEKLPSWREALAESEQRGARRERLRERQQTLIRLLRHKFSEVPEAVVRRIEATEDPERLSGWLDPLLDAGTLAEVERVLEA